MNYNIIPGVSALTKKITLIVNLPDQTGAHIPSKLGAVAYKTWSRETETDAHKFLEQLLKRKSVQKWIQETGHAGYKKKTVTAFMLVEDAHDCYMVHLYA